MNIFGLEIKPLSYDLLFRDITETRRRWVKIFTPNPEIMLRVKDDEDFKKTLEKATYLTSDWIWLFIWYEILASRLPKLINTGLVPFYIARLIFDSKYYYRKFWDRICGSDLTKDLLKYYNLNCGKVAIIDPYFPNDKKKVESQKTCIEKLNKIYPNIDFKLHILSKPKEEIRNEIAEDKPDLLLVTTGMKSQEEMVNYIMEEADVKTWLWIGSSIDYLIWFQKRAPKVFSTLWIEWLYRLITGPQKLKRLNRIYQAIVIFLLKIIISK